MKARILVADDHPPTVALIRTALEGEGFSVVTAANGAECLLAAHRDSPDLIILDVVMPVMDGFQALRVLRENDETKELPVIIFTVRKSDEDVLEGWKRGTDLYLTKPFMIGELISAVKRMAGTRGDCPTVPGEPAEED
jgi:DNA-binding response OmpR family regulator